MNDYDRLLNSPTLSRLQELSAQEFEAAVKRLVAHEFEIARQNGAREAPVTGEEIYYDAPPEHHIQLEQRAVRAILAKKWFAECEAPPWALALGGLPLKRADCEALLNGIHQGNQRSMLVSLYGTRLMGAGWDYRRAMPFEVFCSQVLAG
jgi:hypothetical protein